MIKEFSVRPDEDVKQAYQRLLQEGKTEESLWVNFTPSLAYYIWKNHTKSQRPFKPKLAKEYYQLMENFQWKERYKGSPLQFNKKGENKAGQHRLNAISSLTRNLKLLVAFECDDDTFFVDDTGAPKNNNDFFSYVREKMGVDIYQPKKVSSLIVPFVALTESQNGSVVKRKIFWEEAQKIYFENKDSFDLINQELLKVPGVAQGIKGALAFAASKHNSDVSCFVARLKTGLGLEANTGVVWLHRFVQDRSRKGQRGQTFEEDCIRTLQLLKKDIEGENVESFRLLTSKNSRQALIDFYK